MASTSASEIGEKEGENISKRSCIAPETSSNWWHSMSRITYIDIDG
jgi:hypothetical protein